MTDVPRSTTRLVFRRWRADDLALAQALWGDARVTRLVGGPFDDATVAQKLATELANQRDHGIAYWPIATVAGDIGCCGLRPRPDSPILELGFYLRFDAWAQRFAEEAARSVIAHAFEILGVTALFAGHHPDNHGSRRTLERLGFRYTHHELYPPTGLQDCCYVLPR
jgi:RimJ/RimL family protein N-acetyltransferase